MANLDSLLNKIGNETQNIKTSWEGNASDETISRIESYKKVFDEIRAQNAKYSQFLDSVIEKYVDVEKEEQEFVDTNLTSFNTSYYGRRHDDDENYQ